MADVERGELRYGDLYARRDNVALTEVAGASGRLVMPIQSLGGGKPRQSKP